MMDIKPAPGDLTLSLDEYIRKREAPFLLTDRKYRRQVDEADLDKSLDDYIRLRNDQGQQEGSSVPNTKSKEFESSVSNTKSKELGKFDRKSLRDESDDEDDEITIVGSDSKPTYDSDIEMLDDSMTIKNEEDDILSDLQRFETIESVNNIRVRSQQFRLLPENIVDRPKGARRLEFLPLGQTKGLKSVYNGRIGKNRNKRNYLNKAVSTDMITTAGMMTSGTFVEKGNFTYKYGQRAMGNQPEIVGIERIKRTTSGTSPPSAPVAPSIININFNFDQPRSDPVDSAIDSVINSLPGLPPKVSPAVLKALDVLRKKREDRKNM